MITWIVFLKSVNVGRNNFLSMVVLKAIAKNIELTEERTYNQGDNFVFQSSRISRSQISKKVTSAIVKSKGFKVSVIVLSLGKFKRAIRSYSTLI